MLKMSGSLCLLLDTVYWSPICRRLITCLPSRRSWEHLHWTVEKFDLHKAWRGAKLTCAIFAASTSWRWRNAKENWPPQGGKWAVFRSVCNLSSGYWCCFCHTDKAEFNHFSTWNTSAIISPDLQHELVGEERKVSFLQHPWVSEICTFSVRSP